MSREEEGLIEAMEEASQLFDEMCQARFDEGAKQYGNFAYLGNDVVRMMMEELVDTSNYCRMQFIKLSLLQAMFENDERFAGQEQITIGVAAFKGTGEGWKK